MKFLFCKRFSSFELFGIMAILHLNNEGHIDVWVMLLLFILLYGINDLINWMFYRVRSYD